MFYNYFNVWLNCTYLFFDDRHHLSIIHTDQLMVFINMCHPEANLDAIEWL
jgi:hypothetical protein